MLSLLALHERIYGWAEGAAATPLPFKFCIIFIEFRLRKITSIQNGAFKSPGHPFPNFLDSPQL